MELQEKFPIWKIEEDIVINKKGDLSIIYEMEMPEVFTLSTLQYEEINKLFVQCYNYLDEGFVIHKQDWFFHDQTQDPYLNNSLLSDANRSYFIERKSLKHQCLITFTLKANGSFNRKHSNSILSRTLNASILEKKALDTTNFQQKVEQCFTLLNTSNYFKLKRLEAKDIIGYSNIPGIYEKYLSLSATDPIPADISFKPDFKVGDKKVQIISLSEVDQFPNQTSSNTLDKHFGDHTNAISHSTLFPLGLLIDEPHIINQYFIVQDFKQSIKRLEQKQKRLKSFSLYSSANKIRAEEIEEFLEQCHKENASPLNVHINTVIWHHDTNTLDNIQKRVLNAYQSFDSQPKVISLGYENMFWSGIPGNGGEIPLDETVMLRDNQATSFTYLEAPTKTSIGYHGVKLNDRLHGSPVLVDLTEEPMAQGLIKNRNCLFVGDSGGGKSFYMNHLLRHYAEQNSHIMIVDIGHSYRRLCTLYDGLYFTYSEDLGINPFWIDLSEPLDIEKKESLLTLIFTLWKKSPGDKSQIEYSLLSKALKQFYDKQKILFGNGETCLPTFNLFYEFVLNDFAKQFKEQHQNNGQYFDFVDFEICLSKFYKGGEYDKLLNSEIHTNLRSKNFIVFELDSIAEHPILFPIVSLIIMETFINKMRNLKGVKKVIVIEEAWKAIAKEGFDSFIKYLYKTARKFYGVPIVVTQEIEDLLDNPVVKNTIVKQSDTLFVADLGKNKQYINSLEKVLGFSDHEKNLVMSLNKNIQPNRKYKEIFIRQNDHSNVYAVEVSKREYACYTTEEKESIKINELYQRYGDMEYALRNYSLIKSIT